MAAGKDKSRDDESRPAAEAASAPSSLGAIPTPLNATENSSANWVEILKAAQAAEEAVAAAVQGGAKAVRDQAAATAPDQAAPAQGTSTGQ
jgi:hypothetical protein